MGPHASRQRKRELQSKNIAAWCREMQAMCSSHPTTIVGQPAAGAATRNVPSLDPFAGGLWWDN